MSKTKTRFGSETRAQDGIIVTFDRDGERWSECFRELIHSSGKYSGRNVITRSGGQYAQQAIDYADKHDAKIVCISSPETILRDLRGTRDQTPEMNMLSRLGRQDLLLEDRCAPGDARGNITQVRRARSSTDMSSRG